MGSRRWCVTDNTIEEDFAAADWKDKFPTTAYFSVWQKEKAASGKIHIQGYIKFEKPIRLAGLKKALGNVHAEPAKGSDEQCITYCSKEDTRIEGPFTYGQNKEERQRTDLKRIYEKLNEGSSLLEVLEDQPESFIKFHRGIEKAQSLIMQKRFREYRQVQVHVIYGKTRAGKTRFCMEQDPNLYKQDCKNDKLWFDGYQGEKTILFDDFYGQVKIADMLKYLEGYRCRCEVKGGFTYAGWTTVYITSNVHPDKWYKGVPAEVKEALMARITSIKEMGVPAGGVVEEERRE